MRQNGPPLLLTLGNLAIIPQALNASIRDSDWAAKKSGRGVSKPGLDACAKGLITLRRLCLAPNYSGKIDTMIRKIDIIPPLTDIISCDLFDNMFYPAFLTDTRKRGCIPLQTNSKYSIFLKAAELGSMSKAAMHCNYSQSAVSQIINSLEDELQMALLHRSQFGVVLTAEGAQILPYIK